MYSSKLINALNTITPNDLVKHKYQTELTSSEISMFDKLLKETNITVGVLNVCILYVLSEKNGEIPSFNYFLKVINTWIRAGINDTASALAYINNTEPKKQKPTRSKTVKQLPKWYTKQDEKQETIQDEELDEDIINFFKPNN